MTKTVDAKTLKQWLERGEAVLVDVREPGEHRAAHIDGAHLLPLGRVSSHALPNASGKKLVVHCLKGGRGSQACEKLLAENPTLEIYNLDGGINSWSGAGLPVKTSGSRLLPLDRQVQLTIGAFLLGGLCADVFHPSRLPAVYSLYRYWPDCRGPYRLLRHGARCCVHAMEPARRLKEEIANVEEHRTS